MSTQLYLMGGSGRDLRSDRDLQHLRDAKVSRREARDARRAARRATRA